VKLRDRMLRVDVFTDGRLVRVSPGARLFAIVLDAVAESTGVVNVDPDGIKSAAGCFLSGAQDRLPSVEQIEGWVEELVHTGWALDYERGSMRLLYLRGFGNRQKGANVCIGVSQTTGEIEPHLPTPPCVDLLPHHEKPRDKAGQQVEMPLRKMLPRHCQEPGPCPCERFANPSPTHPEQVSRGKESGVELELDPESEAERDPSEGEREGEHDAAVGRLRAQYGPAIVEQALVEAQTYANTCDPPRPVNAELISFYCGAHVEGGHDSDSMEVPR
jgi:hypothetical protein